MSITPFGTEKNFGISDSLLDAVRGVVQGKEEELEEKKLDPVGQEDGDVDNDGDKDSSDEYLMKRRKAIGKAMKGKKDEVDTDPKLDEENIDEAMRVLAKKGKTQVVTKGDGVAKVMVGGKEVASGDLDDLAGGWFMSRPGEKGQKFFDSPQKIADFYKEEVELTEREDTAMQVARALKKMGVKPNAKEAEVIKKIPGVLDKMKLTPGARRMISRDPDFLGDVFDSLGDMKESVELTERLKPNEYYVITLENPRMDRDVILDKLKSMDVDVEPSKNKYYIAFDGYGADGAYKKLQKEYRKDKDVDFKGPTKRNELKLYEGLEDNKENPANSQHLCAKQVVHEEWGTGNPIHGMHAEPDTDGNIAWYDVMFDHGIEREVSIDEMKVTKSEMHMNHKKKK